MNKVIWSHRAKTSYLETLEFILLKWTVREATNLEEMVNELIEKLRSNKHLCPLSKKTSLRKCVVSKQTSMVYSLNGNEIVIVGFIDNRSQHSF
jgi:plasmid stabilization system protein ParE